MDINTTKQVKAEIKDLVARAIAHHWTIATSIGGSAYPDAPSMAEIKAVIPDAGTDLIRSGLVAGAVSRAKVYYVREG